VSNQSALKCATAPPIEWPQTCTPFAKLFSLAQKAAANRYRVLCMPLGCPRVHNMPPRHRMHDGIRRKGAHQDILSSLSCRRNGLAHSVFTDSPPESRVNVTEKHPQSRHMQVRFEVIDATRVCRGVYLTARQSRRVRT
jgi:hypothetical protein